MVRNERRPDQLITIRDYDPRWPDRYGEERRRLLGALDGIVVGIEHTGSTAVPGLEAKPIIDISVSVSQLPLEERQVTALQQLGYEYLAESGVPGRLYFRKREPQGFNVYVVQRESSLWDHNLLFRDYLQAHPDEARRYGSLKRKLARQAPHDLLLYTDRKGRFICRTLERAREWRRCS
jgi:GrpB-like predicted nucleotidyltransferase (UPF0157 family)